MHIVSKHMQFYKLHLYHNYTQEFPSYCMIIYLYPNTCPCLLFDLQLRDFEDQLYAVQFHLLLQYHGFLIERRPKIPDPQNTNNNLYLHLFFHNSRLLFSLMLIYQRPVRLSNKIFFSLSFAVKYGYNMNGSQMEYFLRGIYF